MKYFLPLLLLCLFCNFELTAQLEPPDPCLTGFENTCRCQTAPVVCSPDVLDGFTYVMTSFQHPADGPNNPMCVPGGGGTTAHNPTWFAFTAWCTSLSLRVNFSGCTDMQPGPGICAGLQAAVFSDCNNIPASTVPGGCNTGGGCNATSGQRTLNLTGLTIGTVYYFLVDGCCGSSCSTVSIEVLTSCGNPGIEDFEDPLTGPTKVCVGETVTHTVGVAVGANTYAWYLDGNIIGQTRGTPVSYTQQFNTPGTFELCVRGWSAPCIPLGTGPENPITCITIEVTAANAGTPVATPTPLCPNGTVELSTTGFVDDPYFIQKLVVTNSSNVIVAVFDGDTGDFTYDACGTFTLYSVNYSSQYTPVPNLNLGATYTGSGCGGNCCNRTSVTFEFGEPTPIEFVDPPPNATYNCFDEVPPLADLDWSNTCLGMNTSPGMENVGTVTPCTGGTITRTWEAIDGCGVTTTHTQNITIDPIPIAAFVDPPGDVTIPCADLQGIIHPPLNYTNDKTGGCAIAGQVNAMTTGTPTICAGGTFTNLWTVTDQCSRVLSHTQTITVTPTANIAFVDPPGNISIQCSERATFSPPNLQVTNEDDGNCLIVASVPGVVTGDVDVCGGALTVTWNYTDVCSRMISHVQTVTVNAAQVPTFVNPPTNTTIPCDELATLVVPSLSYTNNDNGACLFTGTVDPVETGFADVCGGVLTYTWSFTDQCGNLVTHVQNITVTPIAAPMFLNPPTNQTIGCADLAGYTAPSLSYTNNGINSCLFDGSVSPVETGSADVCGGILTFTWEVTDQCNFVTTHVQTVTVTPLESAEFVNPPSDLTLPCHELATFTPVDLNYTNNGLLACLVEGMESPVETGSADECGGALTYTWSFTDQCNNEIEHVQTVTVTPLEPATYVNPPGDVTLACHELATFTPIDLNYSNNGLLTCLVEGMESPVETGSADICGGELTYTWSFTDQCNNEIEHVQIVTVTPLEPATYVTPPGDVTLACHELATFTPIDLNYTNNGVLTCLVEGMESPVETGNADICGGALTYTWSFTDQCNNEIEHVQTVTVTPLEPATYVNPPGDVTLACHELATFTPIDLNYTNNGLLTCLVEGMESPVETGSADICGGALTYTWSFTDQCNNAIEHTQTVTVTPLAAPQFVDPPSDITIPCADAGNYTPLSLSYTNMGMDDCLTLGTIAPTLQGDPPSICGGNSTYTWEFTDQCNNQIQHTQTITVTPLTAPQFINPPGNLTVNCDALPSGPGELSFSNNGSGLCLIEGSVQGVQNGNAGVCGGSFTYTWTYTDPCNNVLNHVQTYTVNPAALPVFLNPPADITVACNQIPTIAPSLEYSNSSPGACSVQGFVPGVITGTANQCGGNLQVTWTYTDPCNNTISHVQNIFVTAAAAPSFTNTPPNITISCSNIPPAPPQLTYTNNDVCPIQGTVDAVVSGSYNSCGGLITYTWQVTTLCGVVLQHIQNITITPSDAPQFIDPPANITVSCNDVNIAPTALFYSNNETGLCAINGNVFSTVQQNFTACGGNVSKAWTYTDPCGRLITHTQFITVLPSTPPVWQNLPPDITVTCGAIPESVPLNYSNGGTGTCLISGTSISTESGSYNVCGGTIINSWVYTDQCNRTISHQRQVTVLPANDPVFLNPPADITLDCDEPIPFPFAITYSNNGTGSCQLLGMVNATTEVNGIVTTNTWSYTHPCTGVAIVHTQNVTVPPKPELVVEPDSDLACEGEPFYLAFINAIDYSTFNSTISYYSDLPFEEYNRITDAIIYVTGPTLIYVVATNDYGCTDYQIFSIDVTPKPNAGEDGSGSICVGTTTSLFSYITGSYDLGGTWFRVSGPTVNISNPNAVNFTTAGNYFFEYRVIGTPPCLNAFSFVTLTVNPRPNITVIESICSADKTTYDVVIQSQNLTVTSSHGTVVNNGNNTTNINGIPIDQSVTISVTNTVTSCTNTLLVAPPNCDCPPVNNAVNVGDRTICFGIDNPTLSVTVDADHSANWYDSETGGTLLSGATLSFTPTDLAPGTYTYWVSAFLNSDPSCQSLNRIPVQFEILELPSANPGQLRVCDNDTDGFASFVLTGANSQVNSSPSVTISYYLNQADANAGINGLTSPFTNTVANSQDIIALVIDADGCKNTAVVTLTVNPLPIVEVTKTNELCDNANNGSVTISATGGNGSYEYRMTGTTYSAVTTFNNLQPNTYQAYVRDGLGCINSVPFTIEDGLLININNFNSVCDDNGTRTNINDDFYTLSWNITNNKGNGGTFRVLENGVEIGIYNYGQAYNITRPAMGQTLNYTFEDVVFGCPKSFQVGPLAPCSTDCEVVINNISEVCNDNNTPTNPNDDFYTISFNLSTVNNPSSTSYSVFVGGVFLGTFNYNMDASVSVPASGDTPDIAFRDGQVSFCEVEVTIGPLLHCSNQCAVEITQLTKVCDDNETKLDATDDFYTITINANAINAGSTSNTFNVFAGGVLVGTFTYGTGGQFTLPASGADVTIEIEDVDDENCTATRNTGLLIPCSTDCQVTINSLTVLCDDNDTESDPSDDFYTIQFIVTAINGAPNGRFEVFVNGVSSGTFAYGLNHSIILPADGSVNSITFTDTADPSCFETETLQALTPCSGACVINAVVSNITCDNNGTNTNAGDDRFFFDLNVTGSNTSASWILVVNNTNGQYGTNTNVGPFNISGGNLTLFVTDSANPACVTSFQVMAPPPCSDGCQINVVNVQKTGCNNAGTNDTNDDDFFGLSFVANTTFPGATQFEVRVGARTYGPFNYGQVVNLPDLPANGMDLLVEITDLSASQCKTQITTIQFPCSVCTQTVVASVNPTILSCLNNVATLSAVSSAPGTFTWTGPNNFNGIGLNVQTSAPGIYFLYALYPDQCEARDTVELLSDTNLPVAIAGKDTSITCLITEVTLFADSNVPSANAIFRWYDIDGNLLATGSELAITTPGSYFLEVEDTSNNCISGRDRVEVIDDTEKPIAVIFANPGNILDCVIGSIELSGMPQTNVIFNWELPEIFIENVGTITVSTEGLVTMFAIDTITGCQDKGELTILDIQDYPILVVEDINPITCDNNTTIISAENSPSGQNLVFTWFNQNGNIIPGQTNSTLVVNSPGTYYVMLTDTTNGCLNIDTLLVEAIGDFPNFTKSDDVTLFCGPTQADLQIALINPTGTAEINWSTTNGQILSGFNSNMIKIEGSGVYVVEVIYAESGCSRLDSINVLVNTDVPESIVANALDESCLNLRDGAVQIENILGGTPPYVVRLNNVNYGQQNVIPALAPGAYNLLITDTNGCTKDTSFVIRQGADVQLGLQPFLELIAGEKATIQAILNIDQSQIASIQWTPTDNLSCSDCLITELTAVSDGVYLLTVIDINGCKDEATIRITIKDNVIITVPNIIWSVGSGANTIFSIFSNDQVLGIKSLRIYDRWGENVFSNANFATNDPSNGWDGTFKGVPVESGVYVYFIEYETRKGIEQLVGDITVIR